MADYSDVGSAASDIVEAAITAFGRLDLVVNDAGMASDESRFQTGTEFVIDGGVLAGQGTAPGEK